MLGFQLFRIGEEGGGPLVPACQKAATLTGPGSTKRRKCIHNSEGSVDTMSPSGRDTRKSKSKV